MKNSWQRKALLLLLWIFLVFIDSSCGLLKREQMQTQINNATRQAQQALGAGDFQKAINICEEIYRKYPDDPGLQSNYIKILESIKKSADRAFERGVFPQAGSAYAILSGNFPSSRPLSQALPYNRDILIEKIEACRKILFEKGLHQYRSGNLNQAILTWKSILTFDPENQEVRKMVNIATIQSENLERVK